MADPFNPGNVPDANDFEVGRVTSPDQSEITKGSLYDYQLYPLAGQVEMQFFANPVGQGIATALGSTVGATKSLADTNVQVANTLPSGKAFRVFSIEVRFWGGASAAANTYTRRPKSNFIAVAVATLANEIDDVDALYQSGLFELSVLDKVYVRETPLVSFPTQVGISFAGAIANNSATTSEVEAHITQSAGREYRMQVPFTLLPQQNFGVALKWPGAVAMPSGFNGRIGVVLNGFFMRATQ